MRLRVGCEFEYAAQAATPTVLMVAPHPDARHRVVRETWESHPPVVGHEYGDFYANRCRRLVLPAGTTTLRYDATVELSREPDAVVPEARQLPVEDLPDDVLVYTLPSRYCLSDTAERRPGAFRRHTEPGWARVQAVCDWINTNITYGLASTPLTTARRCLRGGRRHLPRLRAPGVTFCRALNIPARYVFGYMPDIGLPPPYPPMDFHAWFEVFHLDGGRWCTFDARFNRPRIGRIPIGRGRDAVDVAMVTTYGPARFERMVVWCDEWRVESVGG